MHYCTKVSKETANFIQQKCIKLIKNDSQDIYIVIKNSFKINAALFNFLFYSTLFYFVMRHVSYGEENYF